MQRHKVLSEKEANEALLRIRDKLDQIDKRIVDAISQRIDLVRKVAEIKSFSNRKLRDIPREEDLLTKLVEFGRTKHVDDYLLTRVFQEILEHSVKLQLIAISDAHNPNVLEAPQVVAFQGAEGSYSHSAALRHFSASTRPSVFRGYKTLPEALESVVNNKADLAVLPIENTVAGSINEAYDLLTRFNFAAVGEEILQIKYCLLGVGKVPLPRIRKIVSHPQALALSSDFLSRLDCDVESYADSAMAAQRVHEQGEKAVAAIASEQAAKLYGLTVLARNISNQKEHYTRYMIVGREPVAYDLRVPCKTSVIFGTGHEQGSLLRCLDVFATHGLSFTKLESRPRPGATWEYLFYADFEGNIQDPNVSTAMQDLSNRANYLKVLGSYPARTTRESRPAEPKVPAP